jgi:hypothetical protein
MNDARKYENIAGSPQPGMPVHTVTAWLSRLTSIMYGYVCEFIADTRGGSAAVQRRVRVRTTTNTRDEHAHVEPAAPKPAVIHLVKAPPLRTEAEAWELVKGYLTFIKKRIEYALWLRGLKPEIKCSKSARSAKTVRKGKTSDPTKLFDNQTSVLKKEWMCNDKLADRTDTYTHVLDEEIQKATLLAFDLALYKYDDRKAKFETFLGAHIKASMKVKGFEDRTDALDRLGNYKWSSDGSVTYYTQEVQDGQVSVPGVEELVMFGGGERQASTSATLGRHAVKRKKGDTVYYTAVEEDLSNRPEDTILAGEWFLIPGAPRVVGTWVEPRRRQRFELIGHDPAELKFIGIDNPEPASDSAYRLPATVDEAIEMIARKSFRPLLRLRFAGRSYEEIAQDTEYSMAWLNRQIVPLERVLREYYCCPPNKN